MKSRQQPSAQSTRTHAVKGATKGTSLKGIAFIVDSSDKGPKLVFRYPTTFGTSDSKDGSSTLRGFTSNVLSRPISNQTVAPLVLNPFVSRYTAAANQEDDVSSSSFTTSSSKDPFGGLDTDLLAWMFRPKKVLCNQVFELEIDGTIFVSYPIVLEGGPLRLFNVVFAITTGYTGPSAGLVNSYKAIAKRLATTLLHEENRCSYVSEEVQKMFRVWDELRRVASMKKNDENDGVSATSSSSSSSVSTPTAPSISTVSAVTAHTSASTSTTTIPISGNSTTSSSKDSMKSLNSSAGSSPSNTTPPSTSTPPTTNKTTTVEWSERGAGDIKVDLHTLVDVCLSRSLLACDIKDIYHKLKQQRMAQIIVNSFIPLSLSLRDPTVHPSTPIRPYQTLLLLKEESIILRSLPHDASPQLSTLISVANPLKSFEELYIESGIPLTQLYRLAAHLVYWGCGRIVDTLTKHNMYIVHPSADLRPRSAHAMEFQLKFGNVLSSSSKKTSTSTPHKKSNKSKKLNKKSSKKSNKTTSLPQLLSQISVNPGKVGDFLRGLEAPQQLNFIKMLIWLLKHDYLVQLHMYIHIVIPPEWIEQQQQLTAIRKNKSVGHGGTSGIGDIGGAMSSMSDLSGLGVPSGRRVGNNNNSSVSVGRYFSNRNGDSSGGKGNGSGGDGEGSNLSRSFDEDGHLLGTSYDQEVAELSNGSPNRRASLTSLRGMVRSGATSVSEILRGRSRSFSTGDDSGDRNDRGTDRERNGGNYSRSSSKSSQHRHHKQHQQQYNQQRGKRFSQSSYIQTYLDSIADDTPVYQMLKRLSPYFHGQHHVEEIMWRETVSRKAIQSVFATYTNILCTTLHPKAASKW